MDGPETSSTQLCRHYMRWDYFPYTMSMNDVSQ